MKKMIKKKMISKKKRKHFIKRTPLLDDSDHVIERTPLLEEEETENIDYDSLFQIEEEDLESAEDLDNMAQLIEDSPEIKRDENMPTPKECICSDDFDDDIRNQLLVEAHGLSANVWRWVPAPIEEWILGEKYLNLKEVVRKSVVEDVVKFFNTDGNINPWKRVYDEAVFCEGIGSGKSFKTSIIATYFIHLLLCLRCPQRYFNIDKSSKIAIMNMSVSETNARKVIFSEIASKIRECRWFLERGWDREDARVPDPSCMSELRFKNNCFIIPGSSSWRTAVGYNIIVGIVDEAGSYRSNDNTDQAEDIYHALQRRLGSRFENKGAIIVAGSPLYENDFLECKITEGEDPASRILAVRRPLWKAKYDDWTGEFFYVDRIRKILYDEPPPVITETVDKIPKVPFLYKAFVANITKAYRDFGAYPSASIDTFFENPKIIYENANKERKEDPITFNNQLKEWFKPIAPRAFHAVHIDLGLTGDACGIALGHEDGYTQEGGVKIYVDCVLRLKGSKKHPIQIADVREYIYQFSQRGFPIGLVTLDGFQCLHEDTKISLLNGKRKKIKNIKVGDVVYTVRNDGTIGYSKVLQSKCTGKKLLYRVHLDNGKYIDCSGNHPFMLRNGSYARADELELGMSLMPLYRKRNAEGYEKIYQLSGRWYMTHRIVGNQKYGYKKGYFYHHKDFINGNNHPDNLDQITLGSHLGIHNRKRWENPEHHKYISKCIARRNRIYKPRLGTPSSLVFRKKQSRLVKKLWKDPVYRERMRRSHMKNHKVAKVECLYKKGRVWDIEVEGTHNFAVSAGVFVHNSTDTMQILTGKGYTCKYLSVDRTPLAYNNLKEAIHEKRLDYYIIRSGTGEPSASEVLHRELTTLEEIEGKKIDHPPKGSKDVADAVAGVTQNVIENKSALGRVRVRII